MGKQWYHFDSTGVRISIHAVDERAARGSLRLLLMGSSFEDKEWTLHSATYNRDSSPVL